MKNDVYNLPARFNTSIELFECDLFRLRLITPLDHQFCGLCDVEIVSESETRFNFSSDYFSKFPFGHSPSVENKTHVFEFENIAALESFDRSFRLFNPNHFGMKDYYAKITKGPNAGTSFGQLKQETPNGYFFTSNRLEKNELERYLAFRLHLEKISQDKKINLMIQRFNFSLSGMHLPLEIRLIDLFGLIEMVYVSSRKTLLESLAGELFEKCLELLNIERKQFLEKIVMLYKNRNSIMHGRVWIEVTRDDIIWLAKFTHISLIGYIENFD